MKESDWKIFTKIKDKAIEKYCTLILEESQEVISEQNEHVHNRYLLLYTRSTSRYSFRVKLGNQIKARYEDNGYSLIK